MKLSDVLAFNIENRPSIINSMKNINADFEKTYLECCEVSFGAKNCDGDFLFKIDAVSDFLQEELNTGHWSEVPVTIRQAFTAVSFIKTLIILKTAEENTRTVMEQALKSIDMGLLLGAPLGDNSLLLTKSASVLSKELNKLNPEHKSTTTKRTLYSCESYEKIKAKEIQILKCPSLETFNKVCFLPEVPAKLQDCMSHWPASKKWPDVNYLLETAGNRTVPVELGSRYTDENWTQKLMPLKEFIKNHYLGSGNIGYVAQHNLFEQIPELKADICVPEYCCLSRDYENSLEPDINAWFGPCGTVSPLHFDPKDNLLAQVFGTKQIILHPPSDSDCLYPHDDRLLFNTAQVDPAQPDFDKYPKYEKASPLKCLLEAGEVLYIPPKWWHHVTALDKSFSVSFWWQ